MGCVKFLGSCLHSQQKGANPLFYEDPPYIAYTPFFKFAPPHPPIG